MGGSFSRSALAYEAGAKSRRAGALTGAVVFLCVPFAGLLSNLPMAVLGGIVLGAVVKLLDPRPLLALFSQSRLQATVAYVTFGATLVLAPHVEWAVLLGVGVALFVHIWREQWFEVDVRQVPGALVLTPEGVLWFGTAPLVGRALAKALAAADPKTTTVIIDLSHLGRIDLSGALALAEIVTRGHEAKLEVRFADVPEHSERILRRVCQDVPWDPDPPDLSGVADSESE